MRPPRNTDPSKIRLVTIRTLSAELLLRPDKELNEIVGGVIAKYQEEFDIKIFALKIPPQYWFQIKNRKTYAHKLGDLAIM